MTDLEKELRTFAAALMKDASADSVTLEERVKVLKECRELHVALTKDAPSGDKGVGRRPTISQMQRRIAAAGDADGAAESAIQRSVGRA
jgi:hypothetical protein